MYSYKASILRCQTMCNFLQGKQNQAVQGAALTRDHAPETIFMIAMVKLCCC